MSTLFQVTVKIMIGGLRPNFLDVCKPDITEVQGQGFGGAYYDADVCTGDSDDIKFALEVYSSSSHSHIFFFYSFILLPSLSP